MEIAFSLVSAQNIKAASPKRRAPNLFMGYEHDAGHQIRVRVTWRGLSDGGDVTFLLQSVVTASIPSLFVWLCLSAM